MKKISFELPIIQTKSTNQSFLNLSARQQKTSHSLPYLNHLHLDGSLSARFYSKQTKKHRLPLTPTEFLCNYNYLLSDFERNEMLKNEMIYYYPFELDDENVKSNESIRYISRNHLNYRYEMLEVLGKGSFGLVIRCFDHRKQINCAVKILTKKKSFRKQSKIEIKILNLLKQFDCPNVVEIYEYFSFRNHLCISFELLGINLYTLIKKNNHQGFPLSLIKRFLQSILNALRLLNRQDIIHCDLKPENLCLKQKGSSQLKLIDFGSSCFESKTVYTYIQSRYYRAPEILLGVEYRKSIDMWSLGCILAELYTGHPLFPGQNEEQQICLIVQLIDLPPKSMLDKAKRKTVFFNENGNLKDEKGSCSSKRSLEQIIRCQDQHFLDFIRQCLKWKGDDRLTVEQGLEHTFVSTK